MLLKLERPSRKTRNIMMNKEIDLRETAKHFEDKLKSIKLCLFDVDGILTDGKVYWGGEEIGFNRSFNVLDGYGIRMLQQADIKVGFITGGKSLGIEMRHKYLQLDYLYMGAEDKRAAYLDIQKKSGFTDEEILYMGDELFDMPLLKRAGFAASVPSASIEVREVVDYVTTRAAGDGAAREVIDLLRYVQNITPNVLDFD